MHFPTSWQTLANETPVDTPLLFCTSIVSVGCLIKRSALLDLGPGLSTPPACPAYPSFPACLASKLPSTPPACPAYQAYPACLASKLPSTPPGMPGIGIQAPKHTPGMPGLSGIFDGPLPDPHGSGRR